MYSNNSFWGKHIVVQMQWVHSKSNDIKISDFKDWAARSAKSHHIFQMKCSVTSKIWICFECFCSFIEFFLNKLCRRQDLNLNCLLDDFFCNHSGRNSVLTSFGTVLSWIMSTLSERYIIILFNLWIIYSFKFHLFVLVILPWITI